VISAICRLVGGEMLAHNLRALDLALRLRSRKRFCRPDVRLRHRSRGVLDHRLRQRLGVSRNGAGENGDEVQRRFTACRHMTASDIWILKKAEAESSRRTEKPLAPGPRQRGWIGGKEGSGCIS
jgi:hypothetical protein